LIHEVSDLSSTTDRSNGFSKVLLMKLHGEQTSKCEGKEGFKRHKLRRATASQSTTMATKQLLFPPNNHNNNNNDDVAISIQPQSIEDNDADLPTNVDDEAQLDGLPDECRSFTNPGRPLRHVDLHGIESTYVMRPFSVVWLILIVEAMERFAYYGVFYTQTLYLTGVYDDNWNAGLSSIEAASYVSLSTAVAYSTPFLGAYLADAVLGDYWTIAIAGTALYLPGLALMALTSVPDLLGSTFNRSALCLALFVLWPAGAGSIKSCVNIFGARRTLQFRSIDRYNDIMLTKSHTLPILTSANLAGPEFHPLLQRDKIESYYVHFYTSTSWYKIVDRTIYSLTAFLFVP
jgi:hypothetical protein